MKREDGSFLSHHISLRTPASDFGPLIFCCPSSVVRHLLLFVHRPSGSGRPSAAVFRRFFERTGCPSHTGHYLEPNILRNYLKYIFLTLLSVLLIGATASAQQWIRVKWVLDGDTIVLDDGRHIRYIGINAPEIAHEEHFSGSNPKPRKAEPFGDAAKKYNQQLVGSKKIRLEFDKEKHDRYGRWLAYVFLSDGTFVNEAMIEKGYAYVLPRRPNDKYEQILLQSQRGAMSKKIGLWSHWKKREGEYLGSKKSKRFHRRTCPYGKKIRERNRILFKSKWEAFWSGFAPGKRCMEYWMTE